MHGMAMLSDDAFQIMAYVFWLVSGVELCEGVEFLIGGRLGRVYSFMGSLIFSASVNNCLAKYGNVSYKF